MAETKQPLEVLLIEDDELVRNSLLLTLEDFKARVVPMSNGRDGLADFESRLKTDNPYDIVFTDYLMPGMNGLEIVKRLKELDSKVYVCLVSGQPPQITYERVPPHLAGVKPDTFLQKPYGAAQVLEILNSIAVKINKLIYVGEM